ncbi:MAG: hypothetical protein ABJH06_01600 [Paraglaciecola sp.]|uniref:hypothetical protein n=1 Tax=Paraglaciecola sp. TaxID=1920173 RepID=UPI003296A148
MQAAIETLAKSSALLVAIFFLQGNFYYIGLLAPLNLSTSIYSLEFYQAFIWASLFYLSKAGLWFFIGLIALALLTPFIQAALVMSDKYLDRLFSKKKRNVPNWVSEYFALIKDNFAQTSYVIWVIWAAFVFLIFYFPYKSGELYSQQLIGSSKCQMTSSKGEYAFNGKHSIQFKSNIRSASSKLEGVSIIGRNQNYISVFDGKKITNYRADSIESDSIEADIYNPKSKSEKRLACEAKVKRS